MDSLISFEQFSEWAVGRPEPPYVLLFSGLFTILVCVIPLILALKHRLRYWATHVSPDTLPAGGKIQIILPFIGTVSGIGFFLLAGFEVIGIPLLPSLVLSLLVTLVGGQLAWSQMGRLLSRRLLRSYLNNFDFPNFPTAGNT